jgi:hypothetical protein
MSSLPFLPIECNLYQCPRGAGRIDTIQINQARTMEHHCRVVLPRKSVGGTWLPFARCLRHWKRSKGLTDHVWDSVAQEGEL